jgi:hypothetical protein
MQRAVQRMCDRSVVPAIISLVLIMCASSVLAKEPPAPIQKVAAQPTWTTEIRLKVIIHQSKNSLLPPELHQMLVAEGQKTRTHVLQLLSEQIDEVRSAGGSIALTDVDPNVVWLLDIDDFGENDCKGEFYPKILRDKMEGEQGHPETRAIPYGLQLSFDGDQAPAKMLLYIHQPLARYVVPLFSSAVRRGDKDLTNSTRTLHCNPELANESGMNTLNNQRIGFAGGSLSNWFPLYRKLIALTVRRAMSTTLHGRLPGSNFLPGSWYSYLEDFVSSDEALADAITAHKTIDIWQPDDLRYGDAIRFEQQRIETRRMIQRQRR